MALAVLHSRQIITSTRRQHNIAFSDQWKHPLHFEEGSFSLPTLIRIFLIESHLAFYYRSPRSKEMLTKPTCPVLLVEDSKADIYFLKRVLLSAGVKNKLIVVQNGQEALHYLQGKRPFSDRNNYPLPGIVLLDLRMPVMDGFAVLEWKQKQPNLQKILWVALSNSDALSEVNRAYKLGANSFLSKPPQKEELLNLITGFEGYWHVQAEPPGERENSSTFK